MHNIRDMGYTECIQEFCKAKVGVKWDQYWRKTFLNVFEMLDLTYLLGKIVQYYISMRAKKYVNLKD